MSSRLLCLWLLALLSLSLLSATPKIAATSGSSKTVYFVHIPSLADDTFVPSPSAVYYSLRRILGKHGFAVKLVKTEEAWLKLLENPPAGAFVIIAHGEPVPVPSKYIKGGEAPIDVVIPLLRRMCKEHGVVLISMGGYAFFYGQNKQRGVKTVYGEAGLATLLQDYGLPVSCWSEWSVAGKPEAMAEITDVGREAARLAGLELPEKLATARALATTLRAEYVFYELKPPFHGVAAYRMGRGYYVHVGYHTRDEQLPGVPDAVRARIAFAATYYLLKKKGLLGKAPIYILAIPEAGATWLDLGAARDALARLLEDKGLNYTIISSYYAWTQLLKNPPEHAVIFNCHGEILPLPTFVQRGEELLFLASLARLIAERGLIFVHISGYPMYHLKASGWDCHCADRGISAFLAGVGALGTCSADAETAVAPQPCMLTPLGAEIAKKYGLELPPVLLTSRALACGPTPAWSLYEGARGNVKAYAACMIPLGKGAYIHMGTDASLPPLTLANILAAAILAYCEHPVRPQALARVSIQVGIPGAEYALYDEHLNVLRSGVIPENGSLVLSRIPRGTYLLLIKGHGLVPIEISYAPSIRLPLRTLKVIPLLGGSAVKADIYIYTPLTGCLVAHMRGSECTFRLLPSTYLVEARSDKGYARAFIDLTYGDLVLPLKLAELPLKIRVRCYDTDLNPIKGAEVRLISVVGGEEASARTDDAGWATLEVKTPGPHILIAKTSALAYYASITINCSLTSEERALKLFLAPGVKAPELARFKVRAVDAINGSAISRFRVTVVSLAADCVYALDVAGEATLVLLPGFEYTLIAEAPGYAPLTLKVMPEPGEHELSFSLVPAPKGPAGPRFSEVCIIVKSRKTGKPIAGAEIEVLNAKTKALVSTLISDVEGKAVLRVPAQPISLIIRVRARGYATAETTVDLPAKPTKLPVTVLLERAKYKLIVTVRGAKGKPLAGATVSIVNVTSGQVLTQATTDSSGVASFELEYGRYNVTVEAKGYYPFSTVITLASDTELPITLTKKPLISPETKALLWPILLLIGIIAAVAITAILRVRRKSMVAAALIALVATGLVPLALSPAAAASPAEGKPRMVLAFYYPWYVGVWWGFTPIFDVYGRAWTHASLYPAIGLYQSYEEWVIRYHIRLAKAAGIDAFVSSWWSPPGSTTDLTLRRLLKVAEEEGFKVTIYYESLGTWNNIAKKNPVLFKERVVEDLKYIYDHYAHSPAWLRVNGKPVILIYAMPCVPASVWRDIFSELHSAGYDFYIIGDTGGANKDYAEIVDCIHVYSSPLHNGTTHLIKSRDLFCSMAKLARSLGKQVAVTVHPYYNDKRQRPYRRGVQMKCEGYLHLNYLAALAIKLDADFVLITTWNEWWEGTSVEPSFEYGYTTLSLLATWIRIYKGAGS